MKRFQRYHILCGIIIILTVCLIISCHKTSNNKQDQQLNIESIEYLLDIIQTLIDQNPGYEQIASQLKNMDETEYKHTLDSLIKQNQDNPIIKRKIDRLIDSKGYQLYYRQFRNVKPEDHRRILCALPYTSIPSPADISRTLFDLSQNIDSVRPWVDSIVTRININRSREIALKWLPDGEYSLPPVYFIYDGNGDAFAREGKVVFDLYGIILSKRSHDIRFKNLSNSGTDEIEKVLAHELHHVFGGPTLRMALGERSDNWKDRWETYIIRRMVSEGIAMHCNPPEGFTRKIKEDTAVVAYWIKQLNEKLQALKSDSVSEDDYWKWLSATYQDEARQALKNYLKQNYSPDSLHILFVNHIVDRPSFIYTLGWWMCSRISKDGKDHEAMIQLLSDPRSLFLRYNKAINNYPDSLTVKL